MFMLVRGISEKGFEMARISRKKLLELLDDINAPVENISYETYGRDTRAYIDVENPVNRRSLERFFISKKLNVNKDYFPESGIVEVKINYLKAHGWNA